MKTSLLSLSLCVACSTYDANVGNTEPDEGPPPSFVMGSAIGTARWSVSLGGTDFDAAEAVAMDSHENVIAAGYFSGTVDFGSGGITDEHTGPAGLPHAGAGWLSKRAASDGHELWTHVFALQDSVFASVGAIVTDAQDNVYVTGGYIGTIDFGGQTLSTTMRDAFVAKYAADGSLVWARPLGDASFAGGVKIAIGPEGNVYIVGAFTGTIAFPNGSVTASAPGIESSSADAFIAAFDATGTLLWGDALTAVAPAPHSGNEGTGVAVTTDGDVVMQGVFRDAATFGDEPLQTTASASGFIARFSHDGHLLGHRAYGAPVRTTSGLHVRSDGLVVSLSDEMISSPYITPRVIALDSDANEVWTAGPAPAVDLAVSDLAVTDHHATVIAGRAGIADFGTEHVQRNFVLAAYNADGAFADLRTFAVQTPWQDAYMGDLFGIASMHGAIAIAGQARAPVDFGSGPTATPWSNNGDIVIAVFDAPQLMQ